VIDQHGNRGRHFTVSMLPFEQSRLINYELKNEKIYIEPLAKSFLYCAIAVPVFFWKKPRESAPD